MTQYLPPNLLALFAPRDPIPFKPPLDKLANEKKVSSTYTGVSGFLDFFEDPKDTPPPTRVETRDERKERKRKERQEQHAYKLEQELAMWDPTTDPNAVEDPFKTLFVARTNYDSSESKLRREFESYGPIRRITVCYNKKTGKPRGYAFIEYEHERDMHSAYKHADGRKIDGRRVLVDVERGRTVKGWRPRRLGGGLGGTRKGGPDVNTKYSGRDEGPGSMRDDRSRSPHPPGMDRRRRRTRSPPPIDRRPPRRRSRSPRERRRRSRSRDRVKKEPVDNELEEKALGVGEDEGSRNRERKRGRRSRSKDRSKRSRSRDRKRSRRSRSRDRKRREGDGDGLPDGVVVKQEPLDDERSRVSNGDKDEYSNDNYPPSEDPSAVTEGEYPEDQ